MENLIFQWFAEIQIAHAAGVHDIMEIRNLPFPQCWKPINRAFVFGRSLGLSRTQLNDGESLKISSEIWEC